MVNHENETMRFTKQDFAMVVLGMLIYVADIGADLWIVKKYFCEGHYLWCALILTTGLLSSVVIQFFSYNWFKEDNPANLNWILLLLHFLHAGIFTRYWFVLKYGYQASFQSNSSENTLIDGSTRIIHKTSIDAMADISMLRLFKTFLESTPQLILQIYILMTSDNCTFSQYVSIIITFGSISFATLDYQVALRKSLPDKNKFTKIPSKIMYLFYKLLTLTSWILSIALVTVLSTTFALILLLFLWFGGIVWVLKQHTEFCKSKASEVVYRIVVGIILIFTFFNIRGERTRIPMSVYYTIRVLLTLAIMCMCIFWNSLFNGKIHWSTVIIAVILTLVLGIIFLFVYYGHFHPSIHYAQDVVNTSDVVDGPGGETQETCRIRTFLMQ
ncbi:XK-related protein 9 [Elgaria multicarinata webbii]|uniref:XK-related protein 9 n=1 Tax=Elgaria multicarinata webbii TaxID=159646 RepID=UPI002FCD0064